VRVGLTIRTEGGATVNYTIRIKGLQFERASARTAYQFSYTAFDVTEPGFSDLYYLSYDGTTDSLATASVAWTTDEVTAVTGVRKLSDAAQGMIMAFNSTNPGNFNVQAPSGAGGNNFGSNVRGSTTGGASYTQAAPVTQVYSLVSKISTDTIIARGNGVQRGTNAIDLGTGSFGTAGVFFGVREASSLFFRGFEYSSVGINRLLIANELAALERWTALRTGITL
jgi:hypothetical protein